MLGIIKQGKIELLEPINLPEGTKIFIAPLNDIIKEAENGHNFSIVRIK